MLQQNKFRVSNSYLSTFKRWLRGEELEKDIVAYRLGNLFDAVYTEPNKINLLSNEFYPNKNETVIFTEKESATIMEMSRSLDKYLHKLNMLMVLNKADKQAKFEKEYLFSDGFIDSSVILTSRYDFIIKHKIGIDIKTTQAKNINQFRDACMYFDYDRSRYIYSHTSGTKNDYIIGVQTQYPFSVYMLNSEKENYYESGKQKLDSLLSKLYYYIM